MNYDLIQTIIGFLGLISIILLWWQIKSQLDWNKINLSLDKVDLTLLETNGKFISDFGIDMEEWILRDEDYEKIIHEQNAELLYKICDILDMLEKFSALYTMKVLNKYFTYEAYSENILFFYSKFNKIIEFCRIKNDPFYYKNLEICASEFSKIKFNEQKEYDNKIKKFEKLKQKTMNKLEKMQKEIRHKPSIFKEKF
jgi:hypothetical protein